MKKVLLSLAILLVATAGFAQKKASPWNFRVGVLTPMPVNVYQDYRMDVGSSLFEVSNRVGKKVCLTLNSGFLRFQGFNGNEDFTNIPVLGGARYNVNNNVYFGVAAGVAFFNDEAEVSDRIMYTPHVGYQNGHWSVDMHYFNWFDFDNANNNLALCLSYSL